MSKHPARAPSLSEHVSLSCYSIIALNHELQKQISRPHRCYFYLMFTNTKLRWPRWWKPPTTSREIVPFFAAAVAAVVEGGGIIELIIRRRRLRRWRRQPRSRHGPMNHRGENWFFLKIPAQLCFWRVPRVPRVEIIEAILSAPACFGCFRNCILAHHFLFCLFRSAVKSPPTACCVL